MGLFRADYSLPLHGAPLMYVSMEVWLQPLTRRKSGAATLAKKSGSRWVSGLEGSLASLS